MSYEGEITPEKKIEDQTTNLKAVQLRLRKLKQQHDTAHEVINAELIVLLYEVTKALRKPGEPEPEPPAQLTTP